MNSKRICIIAFKPVARTIHVLRQINYLSPHYQLTVIGHGEPDPEWPALEWRSVPEQSFIAKLTKLIWFVAGRIIPHFYEAWFWRTARHRQAYAHALASRADAFHANDWPSLPIAIEAARHTGAAVVFHMHEYAEEERTELIWRFLVSPAIRFLIRKYASSADMPIAAAITVCEPIAERYHRELGLRPIVVFNAPEPARPVESVIRDDQQEIRLIHHGYAKRGRGLHKLIEALALTDERFTLDFMLVDDDRGYIEDLKKLAERLVPRRVRFRDPVPAREIVRHLADYDVGFCVIDPRPFNNLMMLPNKLFEYIQAGLAVCIGPSPAMASLVLEYRVGIMSPTFQPSDVAATLNRLTLDDLKAMKQAARRAALLLNADVEMEKLVAVYRSLFGDAHKPGPVGGQELLSGIEG